MRTLKKECSQASIDCTEAINKLAAPSRRQFQPPLRNLNDQQPPKPRVSPDIKLAGKSPMERSRLLQERTKDLLDERSFQRSLEREYNSLKKRLGLPVTGPCVEDKVSKTSPAASVAQASSARSMGSRHMSLIDIPTVDSKPSSPSVTPQKAAAPAPAPVSEKTMNRSVLDDLFDDL